MNTMLDKVAVAGDITQALDRRGVWTCAITVIGGTSSTAVKVQSCDTANGTFEDFKTLIPASEASSTQYEGFVVDLRGARKFIKVVGATMATAVFGDCDHDIKSVAITAGEIPSGADLDNNKTATIDVSTYTQPVEITPSEGKDGMKKATVTLSNIPSGASSPMELGFKGWKGKQSSSAGAEDVYVGFLANGQWITDKTLVTDINNVEMIVVFNAKDSYNYFHQHVWFNNNSIPTGYVFDNFDYASIECQEIIVQDASSQPDPSGDVLNISSSQTSMHNDFIYGWQTAEFVESLPLMTYTSN